MRALHYAVCPLTLMTGDPAAGEQAVATLVGLGANLNAALWRLVAQCWEGKLRIEQGDFARGSDLLRDALDACERTGWLFCYPEFMGMLAEGEAALGRSETALATLERALARAETGGESWYVAELLRIRGEVLLAMRTARQLRKKAFAPR